MKLLQWNIWYKEDIANVLKTIKEINPDVVCLQELTINNSLFNVGLNTPEYIAEGLGFHHFYRTAQKNITDGKERELGNAIFSRYPIVESNFNYIQEPHEPDMKDLDYSKEGRVYLEAKIDVRGKVLTVATTHMSYTDKFGPTPSKDDEGAKLLQLLKKQTQNFIFCGDLNFLPESDIIRTISGFLKNAGPATTENTWTTKPFSYIGFEANGLDRRLDYCFATPDVEIKSAEILQTPYSDHLPILIEL